MSNLLSLPTGTVLAGDYRVERVLGAGGFGVTYLALETAVDRYVTIKEYFPTDFALRSNDLAAVPRSHGSEDDYTWGLDRFIDEARTLGKFDHQNIVRLYRYFRENNTAYMVLHFEEGRSLKSWLQGLGRTPRQKELDQLVEPLLDALSVIHQADFLHRDIAPDNIIVRSDGSPVLIDFGSARGEIAQHTRTISALVKPGYSPYEQYAETGKKQGPWTDIYAFAGTLYHAVTGKRPPDSPSRVIKDELQPAEQVAVGSFRPRFLRAIDRGLRLDIDQRPQSIAAWRGELLAPDETSQGWFARRRAAAAPAAPDVAGHDAPTRAITAPLAVTPPPPDAPGGEGRLVDFVDRLKAAGAAANPAPPRESKPVAPAEAAELPPQRTSLRSRLRLGWGVGRDQAAAAARPAPEVAANKPEPEALPVKVAARKPPRVLRRARPRPIPGLSKPKWRPLLFKLLIGFGVASGAVALQDKLPTFELRSSGTVSSAAKSTRPTAPAAEPAELRQARPEPPKSLLLHRFSAHKTAVTSATFADGGRMILTAGADGTIKIWDAESRALVRTLELDDGPATALAARGKLALTGHSEGVIALWDIETGVKRGSFKRNDASIWSVVFAGAKQRFWAASHDWTVTLWEINTPSAPLQVLEDHKNPVQALAFSPANGMLASGGADKAVKLWNAAQISLMRTYDKMPDFVTALAFSDDGETFAAGTLNGRIRVMSIDRRRYRTVRAHEGSIIGLEFDGADTYISAGKDGTIKKWSTHRRRHIARFGGSGSELTTFDLAPDRTQLLTGDSKGYITIWRNPG